MNAGAWGTFSHASDLAFTNGAPNALTFFPGAQNDGCSFFAAARVDHGTGYPVSYLAKIGCDADGGFVFVHTLHNARELEEKFGFSHSSNGS